MNFPITVHSAEKVNFGDADLYKHDCDIKVEGMRTVQQYDHYQKDKLPNGQYVIACKVDFRKGKLHLTKEVIKPAPAAPRS